MIKAGRRDEHFEIFVLKNQLHSIQLDHVHKKCSYLLIDSDNICVFKILANVPVVWVLKVYCKFVLTNVFCIKTKSIKPIFEQHMPVSLDSTCKFGKIKLGVVVLTNQASFYLSILLKLVSKNSQEIKVRNKNNKITNCRS